jgi:hypothetical protein
LYIDNNISKKKKRKKEKEISQITPKKYFKLYHPTLFSSIPASNLIRIINSAVRDYIGRLALRAIYSLLDNPKPSELRITNLVNPESWPHVHLHVLSGAKHESQTHAPRHVLQLAYGHRLLQRGHWRQDRFGPGLSGIVSKYSVRETRGLD